jgi:hypothetical protein
MPPSGLPTARCPASAPASATGRWRMSARPARAAASCRTSVPAQSPAPHPARRSRPPHRPPAAPSPSLGAGCRVTSRRPRPARPPAPPTPDPRPSAWASHGPPHWCSASAAPASSSQARAGEAKKASASCVWPSHSAQAKDSADSASAPQTAQRRAPTPPAPVLRTGTAAAQRPQQVELFLDGQRPEVQQHAGVGLAPTQVVHRSHHVEPVDGVAGGPAHVAAQAAGGHVVQPHRTGHVATAASTSSA